MNFLLSHPKSVVAVIVLLLAFALLSVFRSGRPPETVQEDLKTIHKDMVLQAEQLAGTLDSGARVVLLELDYTINAHGERVYQRVFDAIRNRGLDIQHVERLVVAPEQGWSPDQPGFPYAEYIRVAESFPEADAVIALCGPPYGVEQFRSSGNPSRPKLLVAGGISGGSAQSLCERGWLFAATVPRTVMEEGEAVLKYELLTCR